MNTVSSRGSETHTGAMMLMCAAVIIAGLYYARPVLIPLSLAMLLSLALWPAINKLEKWGLPRFPAVLFVVLLSFSIFGGIGWIVTNQMLDLAGKLPEYQGTIHAKIERLRNRALELAGSTRVLSEITRELTGSDFFAQQKTPAEPGKAGRRENQTETVPSTPIQVFERPVSPFQFIAGVLGSAGSLIAGAFITLVILIFMLVQREDLRNRIIRLASPDDLDVMTSLMDDAVRRMSRFLLMQLLVNLTYGACVAFGLWLVGIPNALLWGLLESLFRFLPYLGPWLAGSLPVLVSLGAFDSLQPFFMTVLVLLSVELINFIEPWVYGRSTGMSPLATLIAAVFWTSLWGPLGLFLSTPLTACILVVAKHVPSLEFARVLLSDEPVLPPPLRVYQRLLAQDREEAAEQVEAFLKEHSITELFDSLLIPVLKMAEYDASRGRLTESRQEFIHESVRGLLADLGKALGLPETEIHLAPQPSTARPVSENRVSVLVIPAHRKADELTAIMVAQVLNQGGRLARHLPVSLASEAVEAIKTIEAPVVCISALPPAAIPATRYLCKKIGRREKFLVIGLWAAHEEAAGFAPRLGCSEAEPPVATIAAAVARIRSLVMVS